VPIEKGSVKSPIERFQRRGKGKEGMASLADALGGRGRRKKRS